MGQLPEVYFGVKSDKTEFNIDDVTLDFSYGDGSVSDVGGYVGGDNGEDCPIVCIAVYFFNAKYQDAVTIFGDARFGDYKEIRQIVTIFNMNRYDPQINDGCIGCGLCVDLCEMKTINLDSLKAKINPRYCCGCLMCVENCPTNSIEILEVKNG